MPFQNPYAARLSEFSEFAFNEPDFFKYFRPQGGGWEEFFQSRMPAPPRRTVFELGCSNAEFLTNLAKANPEIAFIGMDWKFKVLYKGAKRASQLGLRNVALLRGKAQDLARTFGSGELDEVWVFFPDPWAKKSQLKHRLMQEPFLMDMHRSLRADGRIHFKTDHPGYFQWVLSLFGQPLPVLPEYDTTDSGERSYRARQVKVRKTEDAEELPDANRLLCQSFQVGRTSVDFWKPESQRPATLFSETQTLFEKVFVKEGLPIFYIELKKVRPGL